MIRKQAFLILLLALAAITAGAEVIQLDDRRAISTEAPKLVWTGQVDASPGGYSVELSLDGFQSVFYSTLEATGQKLGQSEWSIPPVLWGSLPADARLSWRVVSLATEGQPADRSSSGELTIVGVPSGWQKRTASFTDFSQAAKLGQAGPKDAYLAEELLAMVPQGFESELFRSLEDLAFPLRTVRTATGRVLVRLQTAPGSDVSQLIEAGREKLTLAEKSQGLSTGQAARTTLQPNFIYQAQLQATDPAFAGQPRFQYAPQSIGADIAWAAGITGRDVIVAVLDTGLNTGASIHQEFDGPGKVLIGPDYADQDNDPADDVFHGTAMASIVAAEADGIGMVGIAPEARVMAVRVLGASSGSTFDLAQGIDYAVAHGARVLNLSLSIRGVSQLPDVVGIDLITVASMRHANDQGVVVVASAGNEHASLPAGLGQQGDVIYVGAVDATDTLTEFSNLGPWVSVVAPGSGIYAAVHSGREAYDLTSGTSPAAAVVSGAAALLLSAHPALTPRQVKEILQASAVDLGAPGRDDFYGHGRIDVARALDLAAASSAVPSSIVSMEVAAQTLVVEFSHDMLADGSANAVNNPDNWLGNTTANELLRSGSPVAAYDSASRRLTVINEAVELASGTDFIMLIRSNVESVEGLPILADWLTLGQEGTIRQNIVGRSLVLWGNGVNSANPVAYGSALATEDGLQVLFRQPVTEATAEDPANYQLFASPDNRSGGEPSGGEPVSLSSALFSYDPSSRILTVSDLPEMAAGETFALSTQAGIRNAVLDNPIITDNLTPSYGVVGVSAAAAFELVSVDNSSAGYNFRELISLTFNKPLETGEAAFDPANYAVTVGGVPVDTPDDSQILYGAGRNEIVLSGFDLSANDGQSLEVTVSNLRDLDGQPIAAETASAQGIVDLEQASFSPQFFAVTASQDLLLARFGFHTKMDEASVTDPDHWTLRSDAINPPTTQVPLNGADFQYDSVDNTLLITGLDLEAGDFFELSATPEVVKRYPDRLSFEEPTFIDVVAGSGELPPIEPIAASVTPGSVIDGSNADDVQVRVELSAAALAGQRVRVTLLDSSTPPRTASGLATLTTDGAQTVDVGGIDATAFALGSVRVQAVVESLGGARSPVFRGTDAEVQAASSALSMTRTATPTSVPEPGGEVTFALNVLNTGNTVLVLTNLTDDLYGDLNGLGGCTLPQTIATGSSYTCSFIAQVNGDAGDQLTATATAIASGPEATVDAQASVTVNLSDVLPAIDVTTTASPSSLPEPGGEVTVTVRVEDIRGAEPLTLTTLTSSRVGDLDGRGTCGVPIQIGAGGSYQCTYQATVSGQAGTSVTEVVSATARDNETNSANGQDSATIAITGGSTPGAEITVLPPALDFGDHGVADGPSASHGVRVLSVGTSNLTVESSFTGTDADHFQLRNGGIIINGNGNTLNLDDGGFSAILTPGSWLQFRVLFDPSSSGPKTANLTLLTNDQDESEVDILLTGNGRLVDFGDAPAPYPTLRVDEGARHTLGTGLFLGGGVDADEDGQPSPAAGGDDNTSGDDEDGVLFTSAVIPGQLATVEITASAASTLHAWVDFDGDGTWQDSEQVFRNQPLTAGANALSFAVPAEAVLGTQFARFRLSSDRGLRPTGLASDGEVEDHSLEITQGPTPALHLVHSASSMALAEPGGEVTFTVRIANAGDNPVTLSSLVDDLLGDLDGEGSCSLPLTLAAGSVFACEYTDQVVGTAGDAVVREISAVGSDSGSTLSASDTTVVAILAAGDLPSAVVTHTADPATLEAPGGPVTFSVGVENVGGQPLTLANLESDVYGNLLLPQSRVLFDQTDFASGNGVPDQDFEVTYDDYDAEAADDFEIVWAQGWDIDRVRTVGTSGISGSATVNVVFYADNGGTPQGGASECSYQGLTPIDLGGSLELQLEPSCHLGTGRHWLAISVRQTYETHGQHFWSDRRVQDGSPSMWRNPGDAFGSGCTDWTPSIDCGVGNANSPDLLFQILGQPGGTGTDHPDVATDCAAPLGLATGEAYSCSFVAEVSGEAGEEQVSTVTASLANSASITSTAQDSATVTLTGDAPPTLIFADEFESGDLLAWTRSRTDGGDLAVTQDAAITGDWGLEALINDRQTLWVRDNSPQGERVYRVRFQIDASDLTMTDRDNMVIFRAFTSVSSNKELARVQFRYRNGRYQVRGRARRDNNSQASTRWKTIGAEPTTLELVWRAASAADANDGSLSFSIDDVLAQELTGIDNDERFIDTVRLGAVVGVDAGTQGPLYFDSFASWRE